jgi:recombinational DNA repair ATPase RecF
MDDPEAELDDVRVERLIGLVCSLPVQVFVTQLPDRTLPLPRETERFHVEHGTLRRVI